jgi:hypothetical protein
MPVIIMPRKLYNAPTSKSVAVSRGFVTVSHSVSVNSVGDLNGLSGVKLDLAWLEFMTEQLLKGIGSIVKIFFQDPEVVAFMTALSYKGGLFFRADHAKLDKGSR